MSRKVKRILLTSAGKVSILILLSLKKTIEKIYGDETLCVVEQSESFINSIKSATEPIICVCAGDQSLQDWLWSAFRNQENVLNPVLVLGYEPLESISCAKRLFNNVWHQQQHRYITLPWKIEELFSTLEQLEPLERETERAILARGFSYNAELEKILTHTFYKDDLKLLKDGLARGMEIANTRADDFLIQQFNQLKIFIESDDLRHLPELANKTWKAIGDG